MSAKLENSAVAMELEKFQWQSKVMPKNAQTTDTIALMSHASKVMLKILQDFSKMWTVNFRIFKLVLFYFTFIYFY